MKLKRNIFDRLSLWVFSLLISINVSGFTPGKASYQFAADISFTDNEGKEKSTNAYLWIPENCKTVKVVVVCNQNLLEQRIVEDPYFRDVCRKRDIAILWACKSFFLHKYDGELNAVNTEKVLKVMADKSGYNEIATVPWIPLGHSTTNSYVRQIIHYRPEKVLAALIMKAGPGDEKADKVPILCTGGNYFEWWQRKEELIAPIEKDNVYYSVITERGKRNMAPISYILDPWTGHFDLSQKLICYVADYLDQIVPLRLNNDGQLRDLDLKQGWIVGFALPSEEAFSPIMQSESAKTNPWYPTKELAAAAKEASNVNWNCKPQMIAYCDTDRNIIPFSEKGIVWPLTYHTAANGITFQINSTSLTKVPEGFKNAGAELGVGTGKTSIDILCGVIEPETGNKYRISMNRSYGKAATYLNLRKEGDSEYRVAVEPAQFVPVKNSDGHEQKITFTKIADCKSSIKQLELKANSDAGLPVSFYVESGPAHLENGNTLVLEKMPPRAKFPVEVKVVAWQWGKDTEPKVKAAESIQQSFYIKK